MKNLLAILSSFIALSAAAQSSDWKLTPVPGADRGTVGYIYHTSAQGTQSGTKVITGLRLVCTVDGFTANKQSDPIIGLYWNTMTGNIPQLLNIKVDGRQVGTGEELRWHQDGPLLLRTIAESRTLLQAMKTGNKISFQWTGTDSINRSTIFDLKDFRSDLNEFNDICKTQI